MRATVTILLLLAVLAVVLVFWVKMPSQTQSLPSEPTKKELDIETNTATSIPPSTLEPDLSGTVSGGKLQRGIAGANIYLMRIASPGLKEERSGGWIPVYSRRVRETQSNMGGRFFFEEISPGQYYLRIEKESFAPLETATFQLTADTQPLIIPCQLKIAAQLKLSADQAHYQAIAVLRGNFIEPLFATFDNQGQAAFQNLAPGKYWLQIVPPGTETNSFFWESLQGPPHKPNDFELQEGETHEIKISASGDKAATLVGSVWVEGMDIGNELRLSIHCQLPQSSYRNGATQQINQLVKNGGTYKTPELAAGPCEIFLQTNQPPPITLASRKIELIAARENQMDLIGQAGWCTGNIQAPGQGELGQLRVQLIHADPENKFSLSSWAQAGGAFGTGIVPPGKYKLVIYTYQGKPMEREIEIGIGELNLGTIPLIQ